MANSRAQLQTELDEATEALDQISGLVEEALAVVYCETVKTDDM
jgi:hypothetical protein